MEQQIEMTGPVAEMARDIDPGAWELWRVMSAPESFELERRQRAATETARRLIESGWQRLDRER